MFGNLPSVPVFLDLSCILLSPVRIFQILNIIANGKDQLVRCQSFVHQSKGQLISHFPHHQPGLLG